MHVSRRDVSAGIRHVIEQAQRQERMRKCAAGAYRSHSEGHFRQLFLGCAMPAGMPGVHVDAIGALGGERDAERDQFAAFARDCAVLPPMVWLRSAARRSKAGCPARGLIREFLAT